jgi:hypothetical protein
MAELSLSAYSYLSILPIGADMDIEIEGLDALQEQLEQLADLEGGVPMTEIFTPEFMMMYTEFDSFDEMLESSPWSVESQEDFEEIPEDDFDEYVDENTEFPSWEVMYQTGAERYFERKLGS